MSIDRAGLSAQLAHTLSETALAGLASPRRGKVRDVYRLDAERLLLVATDRVSAFDRVLTTIPFKGEILTGLSHAWFERTRDIARNHLLERPDPAALVVRSLSPVPVEVVVRGFLAGSIARDYAAGKRELYGLRLPDGIAPGERLDPPLVTPTTKEEVGTHDRPVSETEVVARGLVPAGTWAEIREKALALFEAGQAWARAHGLELVDTKYEFGLDRAGSVWLIDEVHTPDSSRYWRQTPQGPQALDKEFLRQWLLSRGWKGDGPPPEIPDSTRVDLAQRYAELFETLEGRPPPLAVGASRDRLEQNLRRAGLIA